MFAKEKLGKQARDRFVRLQENVETGAPALVIFDLTILFLKSYLGMYGWNVGGKKDNIGINFFQPGFIEHKEDIDAIKAFKLR